MFQDFTSRACIFSFIIRKYEILKYHETFLLPPKSYVLEILPTHFYFRKVTTMHGDEVLVPIVFFIFLGVVILAAIRAKHQTRMGMITKGMSSEEIKALFSKDVSRDPLSSLKWGILFVFGGLAILLGNVLHYRFNVEEGVIVGLVCLFAGFGLLLFYAIASKKLNQTL